MSKEPTSTPKESQALTTRQFVRALGGESLYIGTGNPLDYGGFRYRLSIATHAREIAREHTAEPASIHLALKGLTEIVDGELSDNLLPAQKDKIANVISDLTRLHILLCKEEVATDALP